MTFSKWVEKNKDKFTKIPKSTINKWIKGEDLPQWKERNKILWSFHCSNNIEDKDGFKFKGDTAGKGTRFDPSNKMQYYRSVTWQRIMEKKIKSTKGKCEICGSTDNITVHHLSYDRWGGKEELSDLLTCCKRCHMKQHLNKLECVKQLEELESPIRKVIINVKSDGTPTVHVFTDCNDNKIRAYMRYIYEKAKVTKYINNCRLYKTELEGEPDEQNNRWFIIGINKNNEVKLLKQCSSKKESESYKKPGLSYTIVKPEKTIDSEKLDQIYHSKK